MLQTAVESSNLSKVGWENNTLFVVFKRGHTYSYQGVPLEVYNALVQAPSVGEFFAREVKPNYPCEKVLEAPVNSDTPAMSGSEQTS